MDDLKFWELKFGVEVSARYHDWRRGSLGRLMNWFKAITLVGAFLAFIGLTESFNAVSEQGQLVAQWTAVIIGALAILDLVFGFSQRALKHMTLYERFSDLLAKMARNQEDWQKYIAEWEAEAQQIRKDEPPTLWAIYAKCWNQGVERYRLERDGYFRKIGPFQRALGWILRFEPEDFPPEGANINVEKGAQT